jgi:asparagine synthase (glutamine-hydrolysing)
MCGILGKIGEVNKDRFRAALDLMIHRGPDASDTFHGGGVHLGHRRLSIIDLSEAANQPMTTSNGSHSIVYNGEVYNFMEIRRRLQEAGRSFQTLSDTEVVLQAYLEWGPTCLDQFNGMFAFAIVDHETQETFLARDRLGIKPLYFLRERGAFSFASEPKALIHLSDQDFTLNLDAICSYLCFRYPVSGHSFFENVDALRPGHFMRVQAGEIIEMTEYWSLRAALDVEKLTDPDAAIQEVRNVFKSAIRYRMIADVPVGAYLSGGVDSSAVAAYMTEASEEPVRTFTIGFPETGFHEFEYSKIVAEQYATIHQEILIDAAQYMNTLEEMIRIKDAPLGVPNEVPLYIMSKTLKEHITVVLSGEGADEIFGGYGRIFRSADDWELLQAWKDRGLEQESALGKRLFQKYGGTFSDRREHFFHLYRYTSMPTMQTILAGDLWERFEDGPTMKMFDDVFGEVEQEEYATQMMYVFERLHLPGLLQRVDATTMGASVEARVPFVDHRMVELAFRLGNDLKLRWNDKPVRDRIGADISEEFDTPKWILKKAMEHVLPDEILYRKKVGFPVPLTDWIVSELADTVRAKVLGGRMVRSGVLCTEAIEGLLRTEESRGKNARLLWMLFNLEVFLEGYPDVQIQRQSIPKVA